MFESQEHKDLGEIAMLAKSGNKAARQYLKEKFALRIFTQVEVDEVNRLREQGMSINQAIDQVKEETRDE